MQFSQAARPQPDEGRCDGLAGGEVGRVDLVELSASARNGFRLVLEGSVHKGGIAREVPGRSGGDILGADSAVEDVGVRLGHVVKDRRVQAEVLGHHIPRRMGNPVVDIEGRASRSSASGARRAPWTRGAGYSPSLVEISIIKRQEELVLVVESLYSVGDTLGEVPNVSKVEFLYLVASKLIDGRDEDRSCIDETPFRLRTPPMSRSAGTRDFGRLTTRCQ